MLEFLKQAVYEANMELPRRGLVTYTWGNVSGIDREKGLVVIKPSGVSYEDLTPGKLVVISLDGKVVEGNLNPSSDTKTHLVLYKAFPELGGSVHNPVHVPGVICRNHGPFAWGKDAAQAVYHAVVLEEVARMALYTVQIDPDAAPAPAHVLEKHFQRKHGPNAYYGQR